MAGSLPAWERCSHLLSEVASLDVVLRDPELPSSTIEDAHGVIPVEQRAYNKCFENESVQSYKCTTIPIQAVHLDLIVLLLSMLILVLFFIFVLVTFRSFQI